MGKDPTLEDEEMELPKGRLKLINAAFVENLKRYPGIAIF
jgi:hypothetical protein